MLIRSLQIFSISIAPFVFPSVHKSGAHSPKTAMRECSVFVALNVAACAEESLFQ